MGRTSYNAGPTGRCRAVTAACGLGAMLILLTLVVAGLAQDAVALADDKAREAAPWVEIRDEEGIRVYRRDVEGSNLREFRGVSTVHAGIPKLVALLSDIEKMPQWTDNCLHAELVEKNFRDDDLSKNFSDYYEVAYAINRVPWPLQHRDYILRSNLTLVPAHGREGRHLIINSHTVTNPKFPPVPQYVRVPLMNIKIDMTQAPNASDQTLVDFTIRVDPGGVIPDFIVNSVSKSLPFRTLRNINKMASAQTYNKALEKLVQYHYDRGGAG